MKLKAKQTDMKFNLSLVTRHLSLITALTLFFTLPAKAQVTIGSQTEPHDFSILELSTDKLKGGLRLPQLKTDQRDDISDEWSAKDPSKLEGLCIYNTDNKCLEYWGGVDKGWVSMCADVKNPDAPDEITGESTISMCSTDAQRTFNIDPVAEATSYTWTFPAGWVVEGSSTTNSITFKFDNNAISGNINVKANGSSGIIKEKTKSVTVKAIPDEYCTVCSTLPQGYLTFMCYNLGNGASTATDLGGLYQWGRKTDVRTSGTTSVLANSNTPAHSDFIMAPGSPYDWRDGGGETARWGDGTQDSYMSKATNDPCPKGWRVPTMLEWQSIINGDATGIENDATGISGNKWEWEWGAISGYKITPQGSTGQERLFLPVAGFRRYYDGAVSPVISGYGYGNYWSSTVSTEKSYHLYIENNLRMFVNPSIESNRAYGFSVRCVADPNDI